MLRSVDLNPARIFLVELFGELGENRLTLAVVRKPEIDLHVIVNYIAAFVARYGIAKIKLSKSVATLIFFMITSCILMNFFAKPIFIDFSYRYPR